MQAKVVLVIEEQPLYAEGFLSLLESLPMQVNVDVVSSIESAVKMLVDRNFDLVLLGFSLSDGAAHSFFSAIESRPNFTTLVVVTETDDRGDINEALLQGASAYLSKGASMDTLRGALNEFLKHGQAINCATPKEVGHP